jgi:hypothetical protein
MEADGSPVDGTRVAADVLPGVLLRLVLGVFDGDIAAALDLHRDLLSQICEAVLKAAGFGDDIEGKVTRRKVNLSVFGMDDEWVRHPPS